jgi:cytochrome P450
LSKYAPGPRGYPVLGVLPRLRQEPLQVLLDATHRFGDVVYLGRDLHRVYLVNHPDFIEHVLDIHHPTYGKGSAVERIKPLFGEGLTTSNGEAWRHQRRLLRPVFHARRITGLAAVITQATTELLTDWQALSERGQPLAIATEMMNLTRAIIVRALFGNDVDGEIPALSEALTIALEYTNRRVWSVIDIPKYFPTPRNRHFRTALHLLDRLVYRTIDRRSQKGGDKSDLISVLMDLHDEETNEPMSTQQLRDQIMTLFIAGHTTAAAALAWLWIVLAQHPRIEQRLQNEVRTVLGDRLPTAEDIRILSYLRRVINEVMRLYPPTWVTARTPLEDDQIGGYWIPARSVVLLSPYLMHRHACFWKHPEAFDPARFSPEQSTQRPRYAYFPFGGGPRTCIGRGLALMELQLIVMMVTRRYRLELLPGQRLTPKPALTLAPPQGTLMRLHKQDDLARASTPSGQLAHNQPVAHS